MLKYLVSSKSVKGVPDITQEKKKRTNNHEVKAVLEVPGIPGIVPG